MDTTNQKKKNRSKSKGSAFERAVASILDKWWHVPPKTFWRTTNSGGWIEPGDIAPRQRPGIPKVIFPIAVECKHYRVINFHEILRHPKNDPTLIQWWHQVTESKTQMSSYDSSNNIIRLLIFKQNNCPIFVGVSLTDGAVQYQRALSLLIKSTPIIQISYKDDSFVVMPFDVYYTNMTKDIILEGII